MMPKNPRKADHRAAAHEAPVESGREPSPIAFLLPHLGGGGTEKMVVALANGFAKRGYRVDMVLVQSQGPYKETLSEGVRIRDLNVSSSYFALPGLVTYLRAARPRALISSLDLTNLLAIMARRFSGVGVPIAIRIENMLSVQRRTWWKKRLEKLLVSRLYPNAQRIIAVSRAVAADAQRYTGIAPVRFDVIYNPVLESNQTQLDGDAHIHPWFDEGCPPVLLGAGRLTAQKDFETLLKAFALVRRQRDVRLIILGEGEQRGRLLGLARELSVSEWLAMPGFVLNVRDYMRDCQAFVLSSIYEGLPTVLIEALASGCPVISTDCPGGSREILADGSYGELVPVGDAQAMANAICAVLDGSSRAVDPLWLAQFTTENAVDQHIKVLGLAAEPSRA